MGDVQLGRRQSGEGVLGEQRGDGAGGGGGGRKNEVIFDARERGSYRGFEPDRSGQGMAPAEQFAAH